MAQAVHLSQLTEKPGQTFQSFACIASRISALDKVCQGDGLWRVCE